jgi:hypothetical protein
MAIDGLGIQCLLFFVERRAARRHAFLVSFPSNAPGRPANAGPWQASFPKRAGAGNVPVYLTAAQFRMARPGCPAARFDFAAHA